MELLKGKLEKYKLPVENKEVKISGWQEFAIEVCNDFNISGRYRQIIFKHAKRNMNYLQGKVSNAKEKFGYENIGNKGNYLISLFRKTPPWEK